MRLDYKVQYVPYEMQPRVGVHAAWKKKNQGRVCLAASDVILEHFWNAPDQALLNVYIYHKPLMIEFAESVFSQKNLKLELYFQLTSGPNLRVWVTYCKEKIWSSFTSSFFYFF